MPCPNNGINLYSSIKIISFDSNSKCPTIETLSISLFLLTISVANGYDAFLLPILDPPVKLISTICFIVLNKAVR